MSGSAFEIFDKFAFDAVDLCEPGEALKQIAKIQNVAFDIQYQMDDKSRQLVGPTETARGRVAGVETCMAGVRLSRIDANRARVTIDSTEPMSADDKRWTAPSN